MSTTFSIYSRAKSNHQQKLGVTSVRFFKRYNYNFQRVGISGGLVRKQQNMLHNHYFRVNNTTNFIVHIAQHHKDPQKAANWWRSYLNCTPHLNRLIMFRYLNFIIVKHMQKNETWILPIPLDRSMKKTNVGSPKKKKLN